MPEKVSAKIKRLESELSDEVGRSIELYAAIRAQSELIDNFIAYLVSKNIAEDGSHAIQMVRDYSSNLENPDQLSLDLE